MIALLVVITDVPVPLLTPATPCSPPDTPDVVNDRFVPDVEA